MCHVVDVTASADVSAATGSRNSLVGRRAAKAKLCKAHGCLVDLEELGRPYNTKKRLCVEHMKATEVLIEGSATLMRFCQQCGKLEHLTDFDGVKRSCRTSLKKRRGQAGADDDSHIDTAHRRSEQAMRPAAVDTALYQQTNGHRGAPSSACSPVTPVSSYVSCESFPALAPASCVDHGLPPTGSNSQAAAAAASTVQLGSLMLSPDDAAAVLAEAWCEGGQQLAHPRCSSTGGPAELSETELEALIEQELVAAGLFHAPAAAAQPQQQQQPAPMAAPHFPYRAMAAPAPAVGSWGSAGTVAACPAGRGAVRPQGQAIRTQLFSQVLRPRLAVLTAQFEELQDMMSELENLRQQAGANMAHNRVAGPQLAVGFGQQQQQLQRTMAWQSSNNSPA